MCVLQVAVSMKRIGHFLLNEEVDEENIDRNPDIGSYWRASVYLFIECTNTWVFYYFHLKVEPIISYY